MKEYYEGLSNNIKCIPNDRVIDIITCKWKEMKYIQDVLLSVLLYVVCFSCSFKFRRIII